jgi:hypothetical protein
VQQRIGLGGVASRWRLRVEAGLCVEKACGSPANDSAGTAQGLHYGRRLGSRWEDDRHVGIDLAHNLPGFRYLTMLCHPQRQRLPFLSS